MTATPELIGYWDKIWNPGAAPASATLGIAFSGWANPDKTLNDSAKLKDSLVGAKYISLGGGNDRGQFRSSGLTVVTNAINDGQFSAYDGMAFDIEECAAEGLAAAFAQAFQAAPFGCADAKALMTAFFADGNIDILSPQLYTSGEETENDYTENRGVAWQDYASAKAAVAPVSCRRIGTPAPRLTSRARAS